MVKRLIQGLLLGSLAVHFNAYALGLGEIQLDSALNQPLSAEIELLSATPEDADSINVSLASYETFSKVGIDRPSILSKLRFNVSAKDAGYVIKVDSHDSIREPFLDFILEVTWSSGRVLREYTLLLDPPSLKKAKPAQIQAPAVQPVTKAQTKQQTPASAASVQKRPAAKSPKLAGTITPTDEGGISYGPVRNGETLWAIAKEIRSGSSLSTQQMLMALLEENPNAFIAGDINRLKRGSILRLNNPDIVGSLSRQQAAAEVAQRTQPTFKDNSTGADEQQIGTDSAEAKRPSLKLVTPDTKSLSEKMGATTAEGGDTDALRQELTLALEISEAQRRENEALKERMSDLQKQLDALKRLVTLKDGDLAQIQQQLSAPASDSAVEVPEQPAVEEPAAAVAEAPALVIPDVPETETTITDALKQEKTPVVDAQKPEVVVEPNVAPKPQVIPVPAPVTKPVAQPDLLTNIMNDPMFMTAGGAVLVLILLLILLIIKKRGNRFHESILSGDASSMGATTTGGPDTSFLSDLAISGLAGGGMEADEGEVDPLTEADVYMAYGRTQQAESLLKDALESSPDRLELKSKLLEVYFTAKDKEQFDATIADCAEQLQEDEGAWKKILIMGHELSPENGLFAEAPEAEEIEEEELDLGESDDPVFDDVLDIGIDLDELSAEMESTSGDELDFDLGLDFSDLDDDIFSSSSDEEKNEGGAEESSEEEGESFDLSDLELDTDSESEETLELDTLAETEENSDEAADETDDGALDFNIEGLELDDLSTEGDDSAEAESATAEVVEADAESDAGELDFSLDDLDDLEASDEAPDLSAELDDALSSIDGDLDDIGDLGDLSMDSDELELSGEDESTEEPDSNEVLELDTELELDITDLDAAPETVGESSAADESADLDDFDFDFDSMTADESETIEDVVAEATLDVDTDLTDKDDELDGLDDLGDFDIIDDDSSDEIGLDDFDLDSDDSSLDSTESDMDTKIDLAKAYVEMGDADGARNMLNEVISQGDDDQKKQAQDLLDSI
ncbi:MAG: hypothetical protein OEL79_06500 [Chromatiales bacterium]|nr:hypothetical protein [Chromatiales bacterium]